MDKSMKNNSYFKPKPIFELLPEVSCIFDEDAVRSLTAQKPPLKTIAQPRTAEKHYKPLTLAEMNENIFSALKAPQRDVQSTTSTKKKMWNSSVKVENKRKSVLSNAQTKHSAVRKVLNFQQKTKPFTNSRSNILSSETPKYPKSKLNTKNSLNMLARNSVRISGVKKLPQVRQNFHATPLSKHFCRLNSDDSFLQNEKNINESEEKAKAIRKNPIRVNIIEATPVKEYRNVEEYLDNTCSLDKSLNNNTIMNFGNESFSKENGKREESVIVSLCDMMDRAAVTSTGDKATDVTLKQEIDMELNELIEMENQLKNNIKTIEKRMKMLNDFKETQQKSLENVRKLINDKKNIKTDDVTQPSYKIPRKNTCLRKRVFRKSLPNTSIEMVSPTKNTEKALDMYMEMKQQMNFLQTPLKRSEQPQNQNTPTLTSQNLQSQLDKLYNGR